MPFRPSHARTAPSVAWQGQDIATITLPSSTCCLGQMGAYLDSYQSVPLPMLAFLTITLMPISQLPTRDGESLYAFSR